MTIMYSCKDSYKTFIVPDTNIIVIGNDIDESDEDETLRYRQKSKVTCFSSINGDLIVGMINGSIEILSLETNICLKTLKGHIGAITCINQLPNNRIITGSTDRTLRMWNEDKGQTLEGHTNIPTKMLVSSNKIISMSSSEIRIWNFVGIFEHLFENKGNIIDIAVHFNNCLISISKDGNLKVWNLEKRYHKTVTSMMIVVLLFIQKVSLLLIIVRNLDFGNNILLEID